MADARPAADLLPVALAGATGFTGRRVAAILAARGAWPVCLVRASSDASVLPREVERRTGDLSDPLALDRWLAGCRSLVSCASMGFGHVPGIVAAAERAGIGRAVFVSTTAIFTTLPAPSKAVRTEAEAHVMRSRLRWTILRPTMIYGDRGDRNLERLLRAVAAWPVLPVPGTGRSLVQPVHVDDLAAAIVAAWETDAAAGRAYDLSGASAVTLDQLLDAASRACGRAPVAKVHLPLGPVAGALGLLERAGIRPRVKREQVLRLAEDKAFPHDAAARDFGYAPRTVQDGLRQEAEALGLFRG
jgi:uncharacterized protein YbjT (DUF2867 family)